MEPGTALGSYRIVSSLGAGGMGEVYRAHDPKLERDVAIKVLHRDVNSDPERIARFRAGRPEVVVEGAYSNVPGLSYDVGPDGRLLLLRTDGGTERPGHLNVILGWSPDPGS